MILFDVSDNFVQVAKLAGKMLSGSSIEAYAQIPLKEGAVKNREIVRQKDLAKEVGSFLKKKDFKPKVGEKCSFILHDERVYTLRIEIPQDKKSSIKGALKEEVESFIPESPDSQTNVFSFVGDEKREVQYVSANKDFLQGYIDFFSSLKLEPVLATSESYAYYTLLKNQIEEGETVFYFNAEREVTDIVVMDWLGVLETFTGSSESGEVVGKVVSFLKKRWGRSVDKVFFGGENASSLNQEEIGKSSGAKVLSLEEVLKDTSVSLGSKVEGGKSQFANFLGLALLLQQKDPLNLIGRGS